MFLISRPVKAAIDCNSDPKECLGCAGDDRVEFWDKRRSDQRRLDELWDEVEKHGLGEMLGDRKDDYRIPNPCVLFERGEHLQGKERQVDFSESGAGKAHTCLEGRIPETIEIKAFMPVGTQEPEWDSKLKTLVVDLTVIGMVNQSPGGRWELRWPVNFRLALPKAVRKIFGNAINIEGELKFWGQQALRRKERFIAFRETVRGRMEDELVEDIILKLEWHECLLPAPCYGLTAWMVYAEFREWREPEDEEKKERKEWMKKKG